jgi:hypothetical protein
MFIPSNETPWLNKVKGIPFNKIGCLSILDRPIVAWFKADTATGTKRVDQLVKTSPETDIDRWAIMPIGIGLGLNNITLEVALSDAQHPTSDWTVCEFADEDTFLKAMFAFKFQG